jgi:ABC-2 type transport system permease protein
MNGLFPVIRREYLQRVKSRWFLVATFAFPILIIGMGVLPGIFAERSEAARRNIAVVDEVGVLYERLEPRLADLGFQVRQAPTGTEEQLRAEIIAGDLGGYLVLDDETLARGRTVFHGEQGPGTIRGLSLQGAVVQTALEARLGAAGSEGDLQALLSGGELEVIELDIEGNGATESDPEFGVAFIGAMLLYMVIVLYAVAVMRATLEEKTGRIVEILISSIKPWELMLGKILGVGSVGLTQLAVWACMVVLAFTLGVPALIAARPELADLSQVGEYLPGAGLMVLFLALFLGGYFLYSALYAAVGAMCNTEEEAQQAQFPVIMLLVLPIMFLMPIIEAPNSTVAVVASLIPFFTPVLMFARAATGAIPLWQVLVSVVVLFLAVGAVAWIAGRIYRVGILMQGKRPTLPELWRWVREA